MSASTLTRPPPTNDLPDNESPSLIYEPEATAPTSDLGRVSQFPGFATARCSGEGPGWVALALEGELDAYDKSAIIDVLTGYTLAGRRRIHIDASKLSFIDVGALRSFHRVRRFLERTGGTLTLVGLPPVAGRVWREQFAGGGESAIKSPLSR